MLVVVLISLVFITMQLKGSLLQQKLCDICHAGGVSERDFVTHEKKYIKCVIYLCYFLYQVGEEKRFSLLEVSKNGEMHAFFGIKKFNMGCNTGWTFVTLFF